MPGFYNRAEQTVGNVIEITSIEESRRVLASEYKRRHQDAFSPGTIKTMNASIRVFQRWCIEFGHCPEPPISPIVMAEYVEYLGGKIKTNTIRTRLWALSEMHHAEFQPSPCRHRLVLLAFRGVQRKYGAAIGQAPPLCKSEVLSIAKNLGNRRIDIRNKALLLTASDSWCRASELTAMRVCDLSRQEDGSSVILIPRSKSDPYGRGEYAFLSKAGTRTVDLWINTKVLSRNDHIFTKAGRFCGKKPITPTSVSRIFKQVSGRPEVSAHSTRVGGVHDALRLGCDLSSIMIAGRWASAEMPAIYGRKIMAGNSAASRVSEAFEDQYE